MQGADPLDGAAHDGTAGRLLHTFVDQCIHKLLGGHIAILSRANNRVRNCNRDDHDGRLSFCSFIGNQQPGLSENTEMIRKLGRREKIPRRRKIPRFALAVGQPRR